MNSVMDKTRLAEKRYEVNEKRASNRKQKKSNKKLKQYERKKKRENIINEAIDFGRFLELATNNKKHVNGLNLHEIEKEIFTRL